MCIVNGCGNCYVGLFTSGKRYGGAGGLGSITSRPTIKHHGPKRSITTYWTSIGLRSNGEPKHST